MAWSAAGNIRGPKGEAGQPGKPDPAEVVGVVSGVGTPLNLWVGERTEYDAVTVKDDLTVYAVMKPPTPVQPPTAIGWNYLHQPAYTGVPGEVPLPPHQAGDVILMTFNCWADPGMVTPAAGGSVPQWTIGGRWQSGQAGIWAWTRATQSNHTSGVWDTTSTWFNQSVSLRGAGENGSPVGGSAAGGASPGDGGIVNIDAVTRVGSSSTFVTFHYLFGSNNTAWVQPPAGYTKLGEYGWQAPNTFLLSGGAVANEGGTGGGYSLGSSPGGNHMTVQIEVMA